MAERDLTKRMGATALNGVKAANKAGGNSPRKAQPKRGGFAASARFKGVSENDRQAIEAWEAYTRAPKALLHATGSASLSAAEDRVRVAQARAEAVRRQRNTPKAGSRTVSKKGTAKNLPPGKSGPNGKRPQRSTSVRTVSGGSPGLGKRR